VPKVWVYYTILTTVRPNLFEHVYLLRFAEGGNNFCLGGQEIRGLLFRRSREVYTIDANKI